MKFIDYLIEKLVYVGCILFIVYAALYFPLWILLFISYKLASRYNLELLVTGFLSGIILHYYYQDFYLIIVIVFAYFIVIYKSEDKNIFLEKPINFIFKNLFLISYVILYFKLIEYYVLNYKPLILGYIPDSIKYWYFIILKIFVAILVLLMFLKLVHYFYKKWKLY